MKNYEYQYNIGVASWNISLSQGNFEYKAGFYKKTIPFPDITGFGIGYFYFEPVKEITKTPPQKAPSAKVAQLQIASQNPKKLTSIALDLKNPICRSMVHDLYSRNKEKYIGIGPRQDISKALGFTFEKAAIITLVVTGALITIGILFAVAFSR